LGYSQMSASRKNFLLECGGLTPLFHLDEITKRCRASVLQNRSCYNFRIPDAAANHNDPYCYPAAIDFLFMRRSTTPHRRAVGKDSGSESLQKLAQRKSAVSAFHSAE